MESIALRYTNLGSVSLCLHFPLMTRLPAEGIGYLLFEFPKVGTLYHVAISHRQAGVICSPPVLKMPKQKVPKSDQTQSSVT